MNETWLQADSVKLLWLFSSIQTKPHANIPVFKHVCEDSVRMFFLVSISRVSFEDS